MIFINENNVVVHLHNYSGVLTVSDDYILIL
jgi:hypothetical protein